MEDAFYAALERQIDDEKLTDRVKKQVESENKGFANEAIAQLTPMILQLDQRLQELGYRSHVRSGPNELKLMLHWADEHRVDISYVTSTDTHALVSIFFVTDRNTILAVPETRLIDRRDFDLSEEAGRIKSAVVDFTNEAKHHEGL